MGLCSAYEHWELHRDRRPPGDGPGDVAQLVTMNHYLTLTEEEREARRAAYRRHTAGRLAFRQPDPDHDRW